MVRIGIGYDVHQLEEGRPLILGGVNIPFPRGLKGHSDADVLLHAICDALLGAAALGDIGQHFPDSDAAYQDADSLLLLAEVGQKLARCGFAIVNIDSTIAAQQPRLAGYISAMRANIAQALALETDQVSVKATTTERLGFEGREEGISAQAVTLIRKGIDADTAD